MLAVLRTNRDIRLLFFAQVVSYCGDWFAYVAFVGLVQHVTDVPVLVTLVYVAQALPAFLCTPVAGPTVDRFDRKRIIQSVSVVQTAAALGLLVVHSSASLWFGFACLCVISALGSFVGPASQAGLPNLARSPEELRTASLMFGSLWGAMLAIGAGLGGLFASAFGRNASFIADAVSFVLAAALVSAIRTPMQAGDRPTAATRPPFRPIADMREALGLARRDPVLLSLLSSKAAFAIGSGIVGLLAVLATKHLHGGDSGTGLLLGARGAGVALGPLLAARYVGPELSKVLKLCGGAGLVFGVCYFGIALAPALWVAMVCAFIAHLGGGAQWTLSTYGLQARAPDEIRGRILAGDVGFTMLILTVANVSAGLLAAALGTRETIGLFALIGFVAGATYLVLTRSVRASLAAAENRGGLTTLPARD